MVVCSSGDWGWPRRHGDELHVLMHVDGLVGLAFIGNPLVAFNLHEIVCCRVNASIDEDLRCCKFMGSSGLRLPINGVGKVRHFSPRLLLAVARVLLTPWVNIIVLH